MGTINNSTRKQCEIFRRHMCTVPSERWLLARLSRSAGSACAAVSNATTPVTPNPPGICYAALQLCTVCAYHLLLACPFNPAAAIFISYAAPGKILPDAALVEHHNPSSSEWYH